MKKSLKCLTALLLCLTLGLCACGKEQTPVGAGDGPTAEFTYAAAADEGVTLSATVDGAAAGAKIAQGKTLSLSATAEKGTVRVYVNDRIVSLPHTLTVSENISVRAELWFAVTVKVRNPYGLAPGAVTLTEDGFDAELNAQWEYTAQVRSGGSVTFAAAAHGFATAQKTVTATDDVRTELSVDTPVMTIWGDVLQKAEDGYTVVSDETLDDAAAGGVSGATVYEAIPETHWIFSYTAENIEGGAYDIVSLGAILDADDSTSMNLYFADGQTVLETITLLQPEWVRNVYTAQSSLNLNAALDAARTGGSGSITLEWVRDNATIYMFVNGKYVLEADADSLGAQTDMTDRATAFGIFTRANMSADIRNIAYERGGEAVAARLEQGLVDVSVTATHATVHAPTKAYDGQKTEIAFTPEDDYMIDTVTVGGIDVTESVTPTADGYSFDIFAAEGLEIEIACKEQVQMYTVTGHIDVKTYDIAPTDITVTANNHQIVTVDDRYDYTVQAEAGELQLTFAAENFTTVTKTVTVTDAGATQDVDFDEPELTLWAPDNIRKTGKNTYTFDGTESGAYVLGGFQAAMSAVWTGESRVHIDRTYTGDWSVGFTVGSFNASLNICYDSAGDTFVLEALSSGQGNWRRSYSALRATAVQNIRAAMEEDGVMTLKIVRADRIMLMYVNNEYAGSFSTDEFVGLEIGGIFGLHTRGGVKCTFGNVWFDLDEETANAAVEAVQTVSGTGTLAITNATQESDGSITTSSWLGAHYPSVAATQWIMETKMHITVGDDSWFYAGISVNNAGWNNIDFNYAGGVTALKIFTNTEGATLAVADGVDVSAAMLAAAEENGCITLRVLRSGSKLYVFVNGTFAAETALSVCGLTENTATTFGLHASGGNGYECKFYDIQYTADAVAVLRALKEVSQNA